MELIVNVSERGGKFHAQVIGYPHVEAIAKTRGEALRKVHALATNDAMLDAA